MAYKEISAGLDPVAKNGKDNYESPRIDMDYNDINSIKSMLEKFKNNAIKDDRFIMNFYHDETKNHSDYASTTTIYYHTKQPTQIKPGLTIVKDAPFFCLETQISDKSLPNFKKIVNSESSKLAEIQYFERGWYVKQIDDNGFTGLEGQCVAITSKDDLTNLSHFISLFMKNINNSEKGYCYLFAEGNPSSYDDYFLFKNDDYMKQSSQSSQGGCMVIFLLLSSSFFTLLFLILK